MNTFLVRYPNGISTTEAVKADSFKETEFGNINFYRGDKLIGSVRGAISVIDKNASVTPYNSFNKEEENNHASN